MDLKGYEAHKVSLDHKVSRGHKDFWDYKDFRVSRDHRDLKAPKEVLESEVTRDLWDRKVL